MNSTPVTIKEVLFKIRAKIAKPENWTKGFMARNALDERVEVHSKAACKFCISGAAELVTCEYEPMFKRQTQLLERTLLSLHAQIGINSSVVNYNDTHEHEDVLNLIDKTIKAQR